MPPMFNVGDPVVMIPNSPGHGPDGVYENYASGSAFRSSGHDGFMREFVALPADRVVSCAGVEPHVAAITEFVSVTMHGIHRFDIAAHAKRDRIAIIGDGSLAYALACALVPIPRMRNHRCRSRPGKALDVFLYCGALSVVRGACRPYV